MRDRIVKINNSQHNIMYIINVDDIRLYNIMFIILYLIISASIQNS